MRSSSSKLPPLRLAVLLVLLVCLHSITAAALAPTGYGTGLVGGTEYLHEYLHHGSSSGSPKPKASVKKWAALGDSYAAGLGAGTRLNINADDAECARYNGSYPYLLNADARLNVEGEGFRFLACSGATTTAILQTQLPLLPPSSQSLITLSGGGNDVGLTQLLNDCIFQWNPFTPFTCADSINATSNLIFSQLPQSLDVLIQETKSKLMPGGKVFYTAYAGFFDDSSEECDGVSWAFWWNLGRREMLTRERRGSMNALVRTVNSEIEAAVRRANSRLGLEGKNGGEEEEGKEVVFINYDSRFKEQQGRFCEPGVIEPSPNREELLFYEWGTVEHDLERDGRNLTTMYSGEDVVRGDSFAGTVNAWVEQTLREHPDAVTAEGVGAVNVAGLHVAGLRSEGEGEDGEVGERGYVHSVIPDSWKRVFHPLQMGHRCIAERVLEAMVETGVIGDTSRRISGPDEL